MNRIGLIGGGFMHAPSTTAYKSIKSFQWSKNQIEDLTFFIDHAIFDGLNHEGRKMAWIVESRGVIPGVTEGVIERYKEIEKEYEYLFTHNLEIANLSERFILIPSHGFWTAYPQLYNKTKLVSFLTSNKNFLPGHALRLEWLSKLSKHCDVYGNGFKLVERVEEALADYRFTVVCENDRYKNYFSEKILSPITMGTIPIYLGDPGIGEFFDERGIIKLDDSFDINSLTNELYESMLPYVKENFERALKFDVIEDIIWKEYINK
jgi:hypothetical protein